MPGCKCGSMVVVKHALKKPSRNVSVIFTSLNVTVILPRVPALFVMKFRKMYMLYSLVRYSPASCYFGRLSLVKPVYRPCC